MTTSGSEAVRIVTLDEFVAVDEPGAEPLLGEPGAITIPEGGDIMVYGDGGATKTTLLVDQAFHMGAGDNWLGITVPRPISVLLIENEGPRPLFRDKLRRKRDAWKGSPVEDRIRVLERPWAQFTFASEQWRAELAAQIVEYRIELLIAGPLNKLGMDTAGTLAEVNAFMAYIRDLRRQLSEQHRLAVELAHHENKGGAVSGAWEGAGDTLLHAEVAGNGHTILFVQKARWDTTRHQTTLKLAWTEGEGFELEGDRDYLVDVRALLDEPGWLTMKEIATPKDKGGAGAGEAAVQEVFDGHPDVFEMRTGEAAKALGRLQSARLWGLRSGPNAPNADHAFQGGGESVSASASALKDADTPKAPPTPPLDSASELQRTPTQADAEFHHDFDAELERLRAKMGDGQSSVEAGSP